MYGDYQLTVKLLSASLTFTGRGRDDDSACLSDDAVQSLVFWAGVPVLWMLVTLLIIIMYFCYRCCQREVEKSTPCIKWAIGILALLSWQVSRNMRNRACFQLTLSGTRTTKPVA